MALEERFGDGLRMAFASVAKLGTIRSHVVRSMGSNSSLVIPEIVSRILDVGYDVEDLGLVTVQQYFNHFQEIARYSRAVWLK